MIELKRGAVPGVDRFRGDGSIISPEVHSFRTSDAWVTRDLQVWIRR